MEIVIFQLFLFFSGLTSSDVVVGIVLSIGIVMVIIITVYCIVQRTSCINKLRYCKPKLYITNYCLHQNEQPIIDFSAHK